MEDLFVGVEKSRLCQISEKTANFETHFSGYFGDRRWFGKLTSNFISGSWPSSGISKGKDPQIFEASVLFSNTFFFTKMSELTRVSKNFHYIYSKIYMVALSDLQLYDDTWVFPRAFQSKNSYFVFSPVFEESLRSPKVSSYNSILTSQY